MKFTLLLLVLCLALFSLVEGAWDNKRAKSNFKRLKKTKMGKGKGKKKIKEVMKIVKDAGGCSPNVCFALDGSKSIKENDYELQKNFVLLVAGIIAGDPDAEFAATQYSIIQQPIHLLDNDAVQFQLDMDATEQSVIKKTFISAGLGFCINQMNGLDGQPNKIVILGDGRHNFGDKSGPLGPGALADRWRARDPGNKVCAVAVGYRQNLTRLLQIVGGDSDLILEAEEWEDLIEILKDLVMEVCGIPAVFS